MIPLERAAEALPAPVESEADREHDLNIARTCILAYLDALIENDGLPLSKAILDYLKERREEVAT